MGRFSLFSINQPMKNRSGALKCSIKEVKYMDTNPSEEMYEKCLPKYLKNLKQGIKNKVSYLDCLIDELQGSVNSAFVDGDITEEQCDYFYRKYIYGGII